MSELLATAVTASGVFAIPVTVNVTPRRVADLMVGAIEGGSTYWCESILLSPGISHKASPWYDDEALYSKQNLEITVIEHESSRHDDDAQWTITLASIANGLRLMALHSPRHFADFISETDDATTADVFLQYCTFGEVIYG